MSKIRVDTLATQDDSFSIQVEDLNKVSKLDHIVPNIWDYSSLVVTKPTTDPNTWDWTPAFQAAAVVGGTLSIEGNTTYIIDSVSVTKSLRLVCDVGVVFKRKDNSDGPGSSYWIAGAAMFELDSPELKFEVTGDWTYDGNNTNQTTTEPTGFFVKTYPTAVIGILPTTVTLRNGRFINGTSGYVLIRGDNYQRRYKTICNLYDCQFFDTVYGKGKGDPSTPTPLGYSPTYVYALDYVMMNTHNFTAIWSKPLGVGQYSATALLGTYFGQAFANSGECIVTMTGLTYIEKMGRGGPGYDGNWATDQNGIGCIDIYGNGESLYIEKLVAESCPSIPARAKASLRVFQVEEAYINDCVGGVQVSPSSTGPAEAVVSIGLVQANNCNMPVVEFVGTNATTDRIPEVHIGSARVTNSLPPANTALPITAGPVHIRNVTKVTIDTVAVENSPQYGISILDTDHIDLNSVRLRTAVGIGLWVTTSRLVNINNYDIQSVTGPAITISAISTGGVINISEGYSDNTVDYSLFCNAPNATEINLTSCRASNITGLSRAFYVPNALGRLTNCSTGTGVTTPLLTPTSTSRVISVGNSWHPAIFYGGAAAPTTGTYQRGDIQINTFYTGTGTKQFRCTVAGNPGTWVAEV